MPISCYIYHNFLRLTYLKYYFKFKYKKNVLSCYGCFYTSADIADIYLHLSADTDNRPLGRYIGIGRSLPISMATPRRAAYWHCLPSCNACFGRV